MKLTQILLYTQRPEEALVDYNISKFPPKFLHPNFTDACLIGVQLMVITVKPLI